MHRFAVIILLFSLPGCTTLSTKLSADASEEERIEGLVEAVNDGLESGADEEDRALALKTASRFLKDPSPTVRACVVQNAPALSRIGLPRCQAQLHEILADAEEHPLVRLACIDVLMELNDSAAAPPLIKLLQSLERDPELRAAAATALGRFGSQEAAPVLLSLLIDADFQVRRQAELALVRVAGGQKANSPEEWTRWWNRELVRKSLERRK